jgi:hypothetical protein
MLTCKVAPLSHERYLLAYLACDIYSLLITLSSKVGSYLLSMMKYVPDGMVGIVRPRTGNYFYIIFIAAIEYVSSLYST